MTEKTKARLALARGETIVGRCGRGKQHGRDVGHIGRVAPTVEFIERQVRDDGARDADALQCLRGAGVSKAGHEVVIGHHDEGDGDINIGERIDHTDRCRTEIECALTGLLDRATVHDRI